MPRLDLTLDAVDAARLAAFWKTALGYEDEPPPAPFATRAEWAASYGIPEDEMGGGAWLQDPEGRGPRFSILEVPEPKAAKNRLHLDLRVSASAPAAERWATITAEVARLTAAGGSTLAVFEGHHVVMADPEGNEFCVA